MEIIFYAWHLQNRSDFKIDAPKKWTGCMFLIYSLCYKIDKLWVVGFIRSPSRFFELIFIRLKRQAETHSVISFAYIFIHSVYLFCRLSFIHFIEYSCYSVELLVKKFRTGVLLNCTASFYLCFPQSFHFLFVSPNKTCPYFKYLAF